MKNLPIFWILATVAFAAVAIIQQGQLKDARYKAASWEALYRQADAVHQDAMKIYDELLQAEIDYTNETTTNETR